MSTPSSKQLVSQALLDNVRTLLNQSRQQLKYTVNHTMVQTYWHIGRLILEDEQNGEVRASYGKQVLQQLSKMLTTEFGKGFDVSNLRRMRTFYVAFPNQDTLCHELSWSHYRTLITIEKEEARLWYMNEAAQQNWSVRALVRQIWVLYYERLLSSVDKKPVELEAEQKTQSLQLNPKDYLRDPYVLDFLNLPSGAIQESDLEQALIDNLQTFLLELGKGFAFVERQQRISTDDGDFYIDLVFYNFHLKCFFIGRSENAQVDPPRRRPNGHVCSYVRAKKAKVR